MTLPGERARPAQRSPKRILVIIISCISLFTILATLTSSAICYFVFSRPDQSQDIVLDYSQELSAAYPRREFEFSSGRNTLHGQLYSAEQPYGVVIIAHGMRGSSSSHLAETLYFVDNNWSVLNFDGTAVGSSTGNSAHGLQQMVKDILAAIDFLVSDSETAELPIVLYGHSMGAYAAVIAADESEKVEAVVSISGFESPMNLMLSFGKRLVGDAALIGYPFLYLQNIMSFGTFANRSATEAINRSDAAFLIVYGSEDTVICEEESIFASRSEITNPDTDFMLIEQSPRNYHSTAWLSERAAQYRSAVETRLDKLREEYGQLLPVEIFSGVYDKLDLASLFELDRDFMSAVLQFYMSAV